MKTKIVYVLVSSEKDIYLEQAYISMCSLKHHTPNAWITLLTDKLTEDSLSGIRKEEVRLADEIVVVDLDGTKLTAQQRSRQLKTSVRNRIEGDFLFVDCDTVITRPLEDIDQIDAMIAACRDTHSCFADNPYRNLCLRHGYLLGWPIDNEKDYFNSGVIYVKDVPEAHEFYRRWKDNLNKGYSSKLIMDQPAFAKTNYEMEHVIKHLPDVWNCELKHGIRYLKDAKIVHYLCTNPSRHQNKQLFLLNEKDVLMEVKRTGRISDGIKAVMDDPFVGFAETTHCFAGDDLFFFRTPEYNYLRKRFSRDGRPSVVTKVLRLMKKVSNKFNISGINNGTLNPLQASFMGLHSINSKLAA